MDELQIKEHIFDKLLEYLTPAKAEEIFDSFIDMDNYNYGGDFDDDFEEITGEDVLDELLDRSITDKLSSELPEVDDIDDFIDDNIRTDKELKDLLYDTFIVCLKPKIDILRNKRSVYEADEVDDQLNDKLRITIAPDAGDRDGLFVDLDGEIVFEMNPDITHSILLSNYFENNMSDEDESRSNAKRQLMINKINKFAFGSICGDILYIDNSPTISYEDILSDIESDGRIAFSKAYLSPKALGGRDLFIKRVAELKKRRMNKIAKRILASISSL